MHFFVQFLSELQFILAQLHFPKLVKMITLYLFVFVYFKIRVSKFVPQSKSSWYAVFTTDIVCRVLEVSSAFSSS